MWYAAVDVSDRSNVRAKLVLSSNESLVTTDHVLVETWLLIRGRKDRSVADKFWQRVRSGIATLETVGSADLEAAWRIGVDFPDQDFSVVDRTSFAVMRRLGIERAAALDDDFTIFRFGPNRRRAFTIVR